MPELKAIVAVDFESRVQCGEIGCGHAVYRKIHVVQDGDQLLVLGSTCFDKRYGSRNALGVASYGGGSGKKLTDAERELLANNTAALLAQFEAERQEQIRLRQEELSRSSRPQFTLAPPERSYPQKRTTPISNSPWPWMEPGRSMLYIRLTDGTGWVRVKHLDGDQRLVPYPSFEGWDETLPTNVGKADRDLGCLYVADIVPALDYLRRLSAWEKVVGSWRELNEAATR